MARSFASGLVWGFVVMGAGFALMSQLTPLPNSRLSNPKAVVAGNSATVTPKDAQPIDAVQAALPPPQPATTAGNTAKAVVDNSSGTGTVGQASDPATAAPATAANGADPADGTTKVTAATGPSVSPSVAQASIPVSSGAAPAAGTTGVSPATHAAAPKPVGTGQEGMAALQAPKVDGAPGLTAPTGNQVSIRVTPGSAAPALPALAPPGASLPGAIDAKTSGTQTTTGEPKSPDTGPGDAMASAPGAGSAPKAATQPARAADALPKADTATAIAAAPRIAAPAARETSVTAPASPEPVAPEAAAPLAQGAAPAAGPLPEVPAVAEAAPALSSLDAALTAPDADQIPTAPVPQPDPLGSKDGLLVPSQGAGLSEPTRLPQIAAPDDPGLAAAPMPVVVAPDPADASPAAPRALAPRLLKPDAAQLPAVKPLGSTVPTGLKPSVPGVETNALPQIGGATKGTAAVVPTDAAADQPIVKYARPFQSRDGKPLFVILLHDVGAAGVSRAELAKLPFPVTFVVDPLATDAKLAEKTFRDAGQEVLMLANGIPDGATAGDLAQTFQTLQDILPEAVGVIDQDTAGFQDNRALSGLVLPVIADQGRGLVTYDQGLNAADQIARRDGLPAAVIFRHLDGAGESQSVMRRYLDRAAFKAAQEGSVVVIGDTRANTVATILQWTIEGKASGVDLAPVTAVMGRK